MGEIYTFYFPDIGEGVAEGEIVEWRKQVNDQVGQDEPVVVVMTDKATVELPAPYPGKLIKQYGDVGAIIRKGKPLYDLSLQESHVLAAPATRKLAKELGVDINAVHPEKEGGIVTPRDLVQGISRSGAMPRKKAAVPQLPGDEILPLRGVRRLMAERMEVSHQEIPQFSYFEQVDATRLIQMREHFKEKGVEEGVAVTYIPFIVKALSLTLKKHPLLNSSVDMEAETITIHHQHNIGIAMATAQGLVVPVIREVEKMNLREVILSYEQLKERIAHHQLLPAEMSGATITISNYGILAGGGMWATPIINYPEVAILALSKIRKQPFVRNGVLGVCDLLNLSWSFDHRVIDGDLAVNFSHDLAALLQNPSPLL